eukprot:Rmarinus@m.12448
MIAALKRGIGGDTQTSNDSLRKFSLQSVIKGLKRSATSVCTCGDSLYVGTLDSFIIRYDIQASGNEEVERAEIQVGDGKGRDPVVQLFPWETNSRILALCGGQAFVLDALTLAVKTKWGGERDDDPGIRMLYVRWRDNRQYLCVAWKKRVAWYRPAKEGTVLGSFKSTFLHPSPAILSLDKELQMPNSIECVGWQSQLVVAMKKRIAYMDHLSGRVIHMYDIAKARHKMISLPEDKWMVYSGRRAIVLNSVASPTPTVFNFSEPPVAMAAVFPNLFCLGTDHLDVYRLSDAHKVASVPLPGTGPFCLFEDPITGAILVASSTCVYRVYIPGSQRIQLSSLAHGVTIDPAPNSDLGAEAADSGASGSSPYLQIPAAQFARRRCSSSSARAIQSLPSEVGSLHEALSATHDSGDALRLDERVTIQRFDNGFAKTLDMLPPSIGYDEALHLMPGATERWTTIQTDDGFTTTSLGLLDSPGQDLLDEADALKFEHEGKQWKRKAATDPEDEQEALAEWDLKTKQAVASISHARMDEQNTLFDLRLQSCFQQRDILTGMLADRHDFRTHSCPHSDLDDAHLDPCSRSWVDPGLLWKPIDISSDEDYPPSFRFIVRVSSVVAAGKIAPSWGALALYHTTGRNKLSEDVFFRLRPSEGSSRGRSGSLTSVRDGTEHSHSSRETVTYEVFHPRTDKDLPIEFEFRATGVSHDVHLGLRLSDANQAQIAWSVLPVFDEHKEFALGRRRGFHELYAPQEWGSIIDMASSLTERRDHERRRDLLPMRCFLSCTSARDSHHDEPHDHVISPFSSPPAPEAAVSSHNAPEATVSSHNSPSDAKLVSIAEAAEENAETFMTASSLPTAQHNADSHDPDAAGGTSTSDVVGGDNTSGSGATGSPERPSEPRVQAQTPPPRPVVDYVRVVARDFPLPPSLFPPTCFPVLPHFPHPLWVYLREVRLPHLAGQLGSDVSYFIIKIKLFITKGEKPFRAFRLPTGKFTDEVSSSLLHTSGSRPTLTFEEVAVYLPKLTPTSQFVFTFHRVEFTDGVALRDSDFFAVATCNVFDSNTVPPPDVHLPLFLKVSQAARRSMLPRRGTIFGGRKPETDPVLSVSPSTDDGSTFVPLEEGRKVFRVQFQVLSSVYAQYTILAKFFSTCRQFVLDGAKQNVASALDDLMSSSVVHSRRYLFRIVDQLLMLVARLEDNELQARAARILFALVYAYNTSYVQPSKTSSLKRVDDRQYCHELLQSYVEFSFSIDSGLNPPDNMLALACNLSDQYAAYVAMRERTVSVSVDAKERGTMAVDGGTIMGRVLGDQSGQDPSTLLGPSTFILRILIKCMALYSEAAKKKAASEGTEVEEYPGWKQLQPQLLSLVSALAQEIEQDHGECIQVARWSNRHLARAIVSFVPYCPIRGWLTLLSAHLGTVTSLDLRIDIFDVLSSSPHFGSLLAASVHQIRKHTESLAVGDGNERLGLAGLQIEVVMQCVDSVEETTQTDGIRMLARSIHHLFHHPTEGRFEKRAEVLLCYQPLLTFVLSEFDHIQTLSASNQALLLSSFLEVAANMRRTALRSWWQQLSAVSLASFWNILTYCAPLFEMRGDVGFRIPSPDDDDGSDDGTDTESHRTDDEWRRLEGVDKATEASLLAASMAAGSGHNHSSGQGGGSQSHSPDAPRPASSRGKRFSIFARRTDEDSVSHGSGQTTPVASTSPIAPAIASAIGGEQSLTSSLREHLASPMARVRRSGRIKLRAMVMRWSSDPRLVRAFGRWMQMVQVAKMERRMAGRRLCARTVASTVLDITEDFVRHYRDQRSVIPRRHSLSLVHEEASALAAAAAQVAQASNSASPAGGPASAQQAANLQVLPAGRRGSLSLRRGSASMATSQPAANEATLPPNQMGIHRLLEHVYPVVLTLLRTNQDQAFQERLLRFMHSFLSLFRTWVFAEGGEGGSRGFDIVYELFRKCDSRFGSVRLYASFLLFSCARHSYEQQQDFSSVKFHLANTLSSFLAEEQIRDCTALARAIMFMPNFCKLESGPTHPVPEGHRRSHSAESLPLSAVTATDADIVGWVTQSLGQFVTGNSAAISGIVSRLGSTRHLTASGQPAAASASSSPPPALATGAVSPPGAQAFAGERRVSAATVGSVGGAASPPASGVGSMMGDGFGHDDASEPPRLNPSEAEDLAITLKDIITNTVELVSLREAAADAHTISEAYLRLIQGYSEFPEMQSTWLLELSRYLASLCYMAEATHAAMAASGVMLAALPSTEPCLKAMVLKDGTDTTGAAAAAPFMSSMYSSSVSRLRDWATTTGAMLKRTGACSAKDGDRTARLEYFSVDRVAMCLLEAADYGSAAGLYEAAYELRRGAIPFLERSGDYTTLSKCLMSMGGAVEQILAAESERSTRGAAAGVYYRVRFSGPAFLALDGKEFVYREQKMTRLAEISSRLKRSFEKQLAVPISVGAEGGQQMSGAGNHIFVVEVRPCEENTPPTTAAPLVSFDMLQSEVSTDSGSNPIVGPRWFMYEIPFSPSKRRSSSSDSIRDQWVRRRMIAGASAFPALCQRQEVTESKEVILRPVCVMVNILNEKTRQIMHAIEVCERDGASSSLSQLSMLLNGAIIAAVNGGIGEVLHAFLGPEPEVADAENRTNDPTGGSGGSDPKPAEDGAAGGEFPQNKESEGGESASGEPAKAANASTPATSEDAAEETLEEEGRAQLRASLSAQAAALARGLITHGQQCSDDLRPLHRTMQEYFEKLIEQLRKVGIGLDASEETSRLDAIVE